MTEFVLPQGFRFAGVHCGIRERADLALVLSDRPAAAAGVFTQNRVVAAPVKLCRARLPHDNVRGVVVCAGNANACTGEQGLRDAERMAELAAREVGCEPRQMLVASTGVIGRPLPMDKLEAGIPKAATLLGSAANDFAVVTNAILTTDTRPKVASRRVPLEGGGPVNVVGFAKGAAMIGPNLATMLAFVLTDARVPAAPLHALLRSAADRSFNCISVEGHTSTNDTVLILANGASGQTIAGREFGPFDAAVTAVCADLAKMIAADAEGAKHFVTLDVEGLPDDESARTIAKAIADSALVKTAIYGADPNWGRIISAAGYAGVPFEEAEVSLWLGDLSLYRAGSPLQFDAATASAYLKRNRDVSLRLVCGTGPGRCTFWTCDLTPEYVRLNADYTT
ncbi:MAG: bifunctional glutamate N-acetyltransferase/amino-acid acetyltransferase ArgJ [Gemmataceae bacterium]